MPTATISPVARPELADAWDTFVTARADEWGTLLSSFGCAAPFTVGSGGRTVTLVPAAHWTYEQKFVGMTLETIEVRETASGEVRRDAVLLHELGHALGLDHADPALGPSVMTAKPGPEVTERDVEAAACRLGCGPCDPNADPYSIGTM